MPVSMIVRNKGDQRQEKCRAYITKAAIRTIASLVCNEAKSMGKPVGLKPVERSWPATWGNGSRRRRSWREGRVHPKVTRWAQEECKSSSLPYFIKVINNSSNCNHGSNLRIPGAFAREYCSNMVKEVSLENAVDGRTWRVAFRVPEEFQVWKHGWPEFAFHYNFQPGHILVFVLVAHSRFRFTLFNDHGCQIINPAFSPSSATNFYSRRLQNGKLEGATALKARGAPRKSRAHPDDGNHHVCIQMGISCAAHHRANSKSRDEKQILEQRDEPGSAGLERPTCVNTGPLQEERMLSVCTGQSDKILLDDVLVQFAHANPVSFAFRSKRRDVMPVERRAARKAASRYSRVLSNPNSMTVLRPSHVYKDFDCMEIPRRLLLALSGSAAAVSPHSCSALTLIDSTGRSWEMQWNARGRHRLTLLPKDWALFAVHHFLEEGDACVFETTDGEALTVLVRIFRVVDIPSGRQIHDFLTHYSVELAS